MMKEKIPYGMIRGGGGGKEGGSRFPAKPFTGGQAQNFIINCGT